MNGVIKKGAHLYNVTIQDIQPYDSIKSIIYGSQIRLPLSGMGEPVTIEFKNDLNWTLMLNYEKNVSLKVLINNLPINISARGGSIEIAANIPDLSSELFVVKNPILSIQGTTYFEQATLYVEPYKPLSSFRPLLINGNVTFRITRSDNGITLISAFTFVGTYNVDYPPHHYLRWNEMAIPWSDVLFSPLHITLLSCIIIGALALGTPRIKISIMLKPKR